MEEEADLAQRTRDREAMDPAITTSAVTRGDAGVYFDQQQRGLAVFLSTRPDELEQVLAPVLPPGVPHVVLRATHDLTGIRAIQDEIALHPETFERDGSVVVSVGVDVVRNAVSVRLQGPLDATAAALRERFAEAVFVEPGTVPTADTCSSMAYCWPMKGGIRMFVVGHSANANCTTGFLVRRTDNNELSALTAGHCMYYDWMAGADTWGHAATPTGAPNFGWEQGATFFDYSRGDVGLVKLNSASVSALGGTGMNLIHTQDATVNEPVTAVTPNANQTVGDPVCRMGYGTWDQLGQGRTCGIVTAFDETNLSNEPNTPVTFRIQHTKRVSFDSVGGDSGGPVYRRVIPPGDDAPIVYAYGTHVHSGTPAESKGWYTPIGMGTWQFSLTYGDSYTVCTTSAC